MLIGMVPPSASGWAAPTIRPRATGPEWGAHTHVMPYGTRVSEQERRPAANPPPTAYRVSTARSPPFVSRPLELHAGLLWAALCGRCEGKLNIAQHEAHEREPRLAQQVPGWGQLFPNLDP